MTACASRGIIDRRAFTLIELVAVMVIIAVLAAAAVPTLDTMDSSRAAVAARQIARDLSHARQRAVATGNRAWVVFDPADGAGSWLILDEDPSAPGRAGATAIEDPATGRPYRQTLGVGPLINVGLAAVDFDGDVEIGFDWLGRPLDATGNDLAAAGSVTLTSGHAIAVTPETGHIMSSGP
jgi:prepilin-type N-terminal cleavage/methylation domain-containing protein